MYLDQKVKVDCTDHDTQNDGKIIRIMQMVLMWKFQVQL